MELKTSKGERTSELIDFFAQVWHARKLNVRIHLEKYNEDILRV